MLRKIHYFIIFLLTIPTISNAASLSLQGEIDFENRIIKGFFSIVADNETVRFRNNKDLKLHLEEDLGYNSKEDYNYFHVESEKPVIISFIKNFKDGFDSYDENYISIYSSILPEFLDNMSANILLKVNKKYELLINGFSEIEARMADNDTKEYRFTYNKLPKRLHLIASPLFKIYGRKLENGKKIYAYIFEKHESLAPKLIQKASEYINYYEKLLQIEYPYPNLTIVEDISPAGHAIEAMAVFGSQIIGRDFVLNRSLGHEVLHQWIGCLVEADYSYGNWVEALTSYFADYNYASDKLSYRKNILNELESYDEKELYPINKFIGNFSKLDQLIGYGKALMVLHSVAKNIGEESFLTNIILFLKKYSNSKATFKDLLSSLNMDDELISYYLQNVIPPKISFSNVAKKDDNITFNINLQNAADRQYLYYTVKSNGETKQYRLEIENKKQVVINVPNADNVEAIYIDANYDFLRRLDNLELTPAFYNIFNSSSVTMISDNYENYRKYKKISDNIKSYLAPKKIYKTTIYDKDIIIDIKDVIPSNLASLLPNDVSSKIKLGKSDAYIIKNPHSDGNNYILILHNFDEKLFMRLIHYRNYGYILFGDNNSIEIQEISKTQNGILVYKK